MILMCTYILLCVNIKNDDLTQLKTRLKAYVQDIELEKNNAVLKSDYIVKNPELLDILESNAPNLYLQLNLIHRINSFIEIINNSNTDLITIYSSNPDLLKSKFINYFETIPNLPEVRKNLEENDYMYFEKGLSADNNGGKYFTLYRKIFMGSETILRIKAYIPNSAEFFVTENGTKYSGGKYLTVPITDELIAVSPTESTSLVPQYLRMGLIFLFIAVFFCIIIVFASITVTKKTTFAINNFIIDLSKRNVFELNTESKAEEDSYELNIIKNAINTLISKVDESKEIQYRNELEKRRLQLDLLQSKIDPHILYNSLSVISHNAFINKDRKTFDIIENLVSYYRLVLAQGKEMTTIAEEFDMISKYILVNEISHSKSYNFSYEINDNLKDFKILHLSLQPFVENAVVHGLSGRQRECELKLCCRIFDENSLVFEIFDNGYGIPPEKLNKLNNLAEYSGSYGIKNAYDRIKLRYGENFSIHFESSPDSFTRVIIKIPYEN